MSGSELEAKLGLSPWAANNVSTFKCKHCAATAVGETAMAKHAMKAHGAFFFPREAEVVDDPRLGNHTPQLQTVSKEVHVHIHLHNR